jgi:hypothetical protein
MANTYTWLVKAMNCAAQEGNKTDVVMTIHWRLNGTDGTYNATVYGSVGVTYDPADPFTPYDQLTQDQVIGWTKGALGADRVDELEANIDAQLANLANPPVVTPPLPWAA